MSGSIRYSIRPSQYHPPISRSRPAGSGVPALDAEGLNQLLTDPVFGFEYDAIQTTRTHDMADPTLGMLWRFYKGERDSAIFGFGVRFGVAKGDDPDNLVDVPSDDGSTDIRLRMEYFAALSNNFDLRLHVSDLYLRATTFF